MKIVISLLLLIPLSSCFEANDYPCKDKKLRREKLTYMCDLASSYVGTHYEVGRKWCDCVEERYDIQSLVPESCDPQSGMIILQLRQKDGVVDKCGTMDKPKVTR